MSPVELSKAELHVEEGQAPKHQHCEVGDEEGPLIELGGLVWNASIDMFSWKVSHLPHWRSRCRGSAKHFQDQRQIRSGKVFSHV